MRACNWLEAALQIHHVQYLLARDIAAQILGGDAPARVVREVRTTRDVRSDQRARRLPQRMAGGQGFGVRYIESGPTQPSFVERGHQCLGIHTATARDVDEER